MSKTDNLIKPGRRRVLQLLLLLIIFGLAIAAGKIYFGKAEYRFLTVRAEKIINRRLNQTIEYLDLLAGTGLTDSLLHDFVQDFDLRKLSEKGITILAFAGGELKFWTDLSFDVPAGLPLIISRQPVVFVQNGYFLHRQIVSNDTVYIGMLRIFSIYDIENRLLKSGFLSGLGLPEGSVITFSGQEQDFRINGPDRKKLFSISYPDEKKNSLLLLIPVLLWALFGILLLVITDNISSVFNRWNIPGISLLFKAVFFIIFYYLLSGNNLPFILSRTELFKSAGFSVGRWIPTMGHLLILTVLLAELARSFYVNTFQAGKNRSTTVRFLSLFLLIIPGTLMMIFLHHIMILMVSHTNLNFEGYRISYISFLSVVGYTSLFFLFAATCLYLLKIFRLFSGLRLYIVLPAVLLNLLLFVVFPLPEIKGEIALIIAFLLLVAVLLAYSRTMMGLFNLLALFSIIAALYVAWYVARISGQNELDSLKVSAITFAAGHDPVAEYLLIGLSPGLEADTILAGLMKRDIIDEDVADSISDYLKDTYFGSYWSNYDVSIVLCDNKSRLIIDDGKEVADNCFMFFENIAGERGDAITGTPFWFIEYNTGRPAYLGKLFYELPDGRVNGLFIEFMSYINVFREGYPELLTDEKYMRPSLLKDYSLAKYVDGTLVLSTGVFSHPVSDNGFVCPDDEYVSVENKGYSHFAYRHGNVTVVFSRKTIPFINRVVSFGYIFIYFLILSAVFALIFEKNRVLSLYFHSFRQKLQFSFLAIILFSFFAIAAGASYLSIEQYRQKHYDSLREKTGSLYIELEHKLERERQLNGDWSDNQYQSLSDLLVKFSNVFSIDINMFDNAGRLIATSRPEVFIRDLAGRRMNYFALIELGSFSESEYIGRERIGRLEYLSIYVPFYNARNEFLAYLNIPYFGMQSKLATEISNLIVAIVNFSLLMILITMSFAVLISERITFPLRLLGDMLASVRLGSKSARLKYDARDEIGELVRQYNRMVEELEESARKLTVSEREYAWREMAKQIAHEIKNPLTPMKLNVQQLNKAFHDGVPGFEKKLGKFTRNQIEYIDNLSRIATAFSSFARMPKAEPAQVDLLAQIKTTLELFKNTDNVGFRISFPPDKTIVVFVDREHLNSVFSNLVKNAIQAIPHDRQGIIKFTVLPEGDRVSVNISDNGNGIPEALKERLFTPYFTTKSSGSGLGLSIVKRLVEGMAGEISFTSKQGEGTVFTIILPVFYSIEKSE